MLGTVRKRRRSIGQTKVEQDVARILPPDREDLTDAGRGDYALCLMGEHTVAGVRIARSQAPSEVQQHLNAAQDAIQAAQDAQNRAQDAVQRAQDAYNREHAARGGRGDYHTAEPGELARRLGNDAMSPNSPARELLRIREGFLSR